MACFVFLLIFVKNLTQKEKIPKIMNSKGVAMYLCSYVIYQSRIFGLSHLLLQISSTDKRRLRAGSVLDTTDEGKSALKNVM